MGPIGLSKSKSRKSQKMSTNFNPSASTSTSTTTTTTEKEEDRTYPLDSDSLTLIDLFELHESVLELIEVGSERTEEETEEASGLCRGILHGCQSLESLLSRDTVEAEEASSSPSTSKVEPSTLESLGLSHRLSSIQLSYLQAFALYNLSSLLPPPVLSSLPSTLIGDQKKRKLDSLKEPSDPKEWLELSLGFYEKSLTGLKEVYFVGEDLEEVKEREKNRWNLIILTEKMKANCTLAERGLREPSSSQDYSHQINLVKSVEEDLEPLITLLVSIQQPLPESAEEEDDSTGLKVTLSPTLESLSTLSALSSYVTLLDQYPTLGSLSHRVNLLKTIGPILLLIEDEVLEKALMVTGELVLARFGLEEEILEEKFRPTIEDEEESDVVVPLPDCEEVREVKALGLNVVETLKITIQMILMQEEQDLNALLRQYKSLQEAYELYSCLINEDEIKDLKENSTSLEQIEEKIQELLEVLHGDEEEEEEEEEEEAEE